MLPPLIVPRSAANIRFVFREVTLSIALLKSSCMMRSFELIFNLVNFSLFLRLACTVGTTCFKLLGSTTNCYWAIKDEIEIAKWEKCGTFVFQLWIFNFPGVPLR